MANTKNSGTEQVWQNSLLESVLFLMTPEQREYFLSSRSSTGMIYANKTPEFDSHFSVFLTPTAYSGLCDYLKSEQFETEGLSEIDFFKKDMEDGIRIYSSLSNPTQNIDGNDEINVRIFSRFFHMSSYLQLINPEQAILRATYIGSSIQPKNNGDDKEKKDQEIDLYGNIDTDESEDSDLLGIVPETSKQSELESRPFFPHIKTQWHIYKNYSEDCEFFDPEAAKKLIFDISNNRQLSGIHFQKRKHLKQLLDTVTLSQLAAQYRYRIKNKNETLEYPATYELDIDDPFEEITNIQSGHVYDDQDEDGFNDTDSIYHRIEKLIKERLKKPAKIKYTGSQNGHYLFESSDGRPVPESGFLADVGVESKIKKQQDAIRCITAQNTSNHLIRLGTLLGEINTEKLEEFDFETEHLNLFDNLLSGKQKEAVAKSLGTPDICLIQGPPGTGKTRVISEIVRQASKKDFKTLLVAPTHVAVDNVLEKIGVEDDISAVRCVNKDKLDDLDEHIRQFSFEQRRESVLNHSCTRVKKDIQRLEQEKSDLQTTSNTLKEFISKYGIATELDEKLKRLENTFYSTEKTIRKKYNEKTKSSKNKIVRTDNSLLDSKMKLDFARNQLKDAVEQADQFKSGNYTDQQLKQIEQALVDAEKTHGQSLRQLKDKLNNTHKNIHSLNQQILQEKTNIENTKNTLLQIDKGILPQDVKDAVIAAVNNASAKCDKEIASNLGKLKYRQKKLQQNDINNTHLKGQIETIRQNINDLNENKQNHWWKKPFNAIWWKSLFKDYEVLLKNYTKNLEESLNLIPQLKQDITDAAEVLKQSQDSKKDIVSTAKKQEFKAQCNLYRDLYNDQVKKLQSLNKHLEDDNLAIPTIEEQIKAAKDELDLILKQAETDIKNSISSQLNIKTMDACNNVVNCENALKASHKISLKAQIESVKLEDEIIKTITTELDQLKLRIKTTKEDITSNFNDIQLLQKKAEELIENKLPKEIEDIKKLIKKLDPEIKKHTELIDFSRRWLEYLLRDSGLLSRHLAKYINLVCATTVGIASDEYFGDGRPLEQKQFDLLVVDEAGKVTEPEFLVAATRAKKWVIVGDHKQLPPYYDRKLNKIFAGVNKLRRKELPRLTPEPLQISYFENLWNSLYNNSGDTDKAQSRFVQLDMQRRMHPDLALFISDMFYDNKYNSPEQEEFINKKTLRLSHFEHAVTLIEVCPAKKQRHGLEIKLSSSYARKKLKLPQQTGYANLHEARKVIEVLRSILMEEAIYTEQQQLNKVNDSSAAIGIMAFYAGQVELIRRLIKEDKSLDASACGNGQFICKESVTVIVNSVDAFQGKECSVIILSFTRSNPYQNIGFVDDANRLNVAMSRARKKLILIGDTNTFRRRVNANDKRVKCNSSETIRAEREFFEKLIEYIQGRGEIKKVFGLIEDDK